MPVLSRFFGIIIHMYFQQAEHNPPHIHATYGGSAAEIEIKSGNIIEGCLPAKELALVREWISIYKDELLTMWQTQEFKRLPPLK